MITRKDILFLDRCCQLAKLALKNTKENPMVGAVVVYQDQIIGEGYHHSVGESHAEVNAIASIDKKNKPLLSKSTIYVSLEPCSHYGHTPPCADLIISKKMPRVVIGAIDPTEKVRGKGVERMRKAGIEVEVCPNHKESEILKKMFETNALENRPWVIGHLALSKDGYMGRADKQVWFSNPYTSISSHKMRSEVDGIMVGTGTALLDDPALTLRHYPGESPLRIVLDRRLRIPSGHQLLSDDLPTLVINGETNKKGLKEYVKLDFLSAMFPELLMEYLFREKKIYRLMVEGGRRWFDTLLSHGLIDEMEVIHTDTVLGYGVKGPYFAGALMNAMTVGNDRIERSLLDKEKINQE